MSTAWGIYITCCLKNWQQDGLGAVQVDSLGTGWHWDHQLHRNCQYLHPNETFGVRWSIHAGRGWSADGEWDWWRRSRWGCSHDLDCSFWVHAQVFGYECMPADVAMVFILARWYIAVLRNEIEGHPWRVLVCHGARPDKASTHDHNRERSVWWDIVSE